MEVDVVVVGSGASGLTAAVVAAKAGLKVLVVEKAACFGGTTALSYGAPWIINNPYQKEQALDDSAEAGHAYLRAVLGNYYDQEKATAFIESGSEMIAYLSENSEARWICFPVADYSPGEDGFRLGRTLLVSDFDGRALGKWLRHIRRPLPGFSILGGMQINPVDAPMYKATFRNIRGFTFTTKKVLSYTWHRFRYGAGAYMANGNALVGRLMKSGLDAGVEFWREAPAVRLLTSDKAVVGVVVRKNGQDIDVKACCGVVLASGGFGANKELQAKYIPHPDHHISVQPKENVGDGMALGQQAGGALGEINPENGVWAPVSVRRHRDGNIDKYPHFGPDRGKPGSIIVDENGRRFADEAEPYQPFVRKMNKLDITTAYFIGDRKFIRDYGMGFALPAPYRIGSLIRDGYLIKAGTIPDLANKLGIDPAVLNETIVDFNGHAKRGEDPDFGRGGNIYDHGQGDPEHKPNPNLRPLGAGPYYAVKLHPGNVSTVLGLDTNADGQVRSVDGGVIEGLYAVGLDQNSVMRGFYPGGGCGIGPGMTFAYRAARHISGQRPRN